MNPTTPNRVTIGIPTRNRRELVLMAIHSALAQDHADVEVVVSDNASTDDTIEHLSRIQEPRLIVIAQPTNVGMTGNFNACLDRAGGEFFLMLSDDDLLEPDAISSLLRGIRGGADGTAPHRPTAARGLAWSPCTLIDGSGTPLWVTDGGPEVESSADLVVGLLDGSRGPRLCSILIRTADAREVGGYQAAHGPICDLGNWTRVALKYTTVACVPRPVARYTMHTVSETSRSACKTWEEAGENVSKDILAFIRQRGDDAAYSRVQRAVSPFITNLIVTVLMQNLGRPGWLRLFASEGIRSRKYLLNTFVVGRLLRDGRKLLRLRRGSRTRARV